MSDQQIADRPSEADDSSAAPSASVSAVVVAYSDERWGRLLRAIESVRQQTKPPAEIVVVVDGNDALLSRLSDELVGVRLLKNSQEPGAGGARNTGVSASSGDIVAFLDDDAEAACDCYERMLPQFDSDHVLGVGGRLVPEWETGRPIWFPDEFLWVVGCSYPGLPGRVAPVRNLIAANMLVRRDLFARIDGFRSGFGKSGKRSGAEETDLCIRGSQENPDGAWLHDPAAVARHWVPESRATFRYFIQRCQDEGLAKAAVTRWVGASVGLGSERAYMLRVIPAGLFRGFLSPVKGDWFGPVRSIAILVGLACTALGYIRGMMRLSYS